MPEQRVQRRLAAILAADVVGYSAMMGRDEAGTLARLNALRRELLHPKVEEYGGRIVKTTGDGVLIEFPSAVDAVQHAVDIQQAVARRNAGLASEERMEFRVGINLGDVIVEGDDIFGDGVNIAARLEAVADPGGICVSAIVHQSVQAKLEIAFDDLGTKSLKNIAEPVHVFAVATGGGADDRAPAARPESIFRRPAVAVLPFQNLSGDAEQEYFADGLTEDIITALSQWRSFPVIARNSTFRYKGTAPDIRRVGEELGARYVLEGSVRKAGARVRVTAQLINADAGHHVWAERYDRELADIFDLQDEITRRIVATLVPELERAEREKSAFAPPANLDAWDCYLHGIAYLNDLSVDAIPRSREMLERAIALDPGYAKAHAKLALSYHRELWLDACADRQRSLEAVLDHARTAVRLDDGDAFCHAVLGLALAWHGDLERAVQEALRAFALNPIDMDAAFTAGQLLACNGQPKEAIPHIENALRISPHDPRFPMVYSQLAAAYFDAGDYEPALEWARKGADLDGGGAANPNTSFAALLRIASLAHLGRTEEAKAAAAAAGPNAALFDGVEGMLGMRRKATTREMILDGLGKAGLAD